MIQFLHPAWLWGLAALAVPLVLHLIERRRSAPSDFPPAVLLAAGAAEAARARRLREILQLAARMTLLAAMVLCFSRPVLVAEPGATDNSKAPDGPALGLVIVIDDSASSGRPADPADPRGPTRLDLALAESRSALRALGPGSEAAVVFASGRSIGPLAPPDAEKALGEHSAMPGNADLARALGASGEFLDAMAPLPGAVLVLADSGSGALPAAVPEALARRARVSGVDLGSRGVGDDWAVLDARLEAPRLVAGEPRNMLVRVSRAQSGSGRGAPEARRLELVLDGVAAAWREVTLEPGAEVELELEFTAAAGTHLGELRLAGKDPWATNDHLPVAVAAVPAARVMVVSTRKELADAAAAVRLALSAGPGEERKAFLAETLAAESAALADFSAARAVILVGPPRLGPEATARIARVAAEGAGVVVLASDAAALDELAVPLGLPVPSSAPNARDFASPARLVPAAEGAELFAPLGDAAAAACFHHALRLDAGGGTVLAALRSADGELPGLIERPCGRGRVLVLASSPERGWSDLAGREEAALFVPLMHELAARAAGLNPAETPARPGGSVSLAVNGRERGARFWLEDARGIRIPAGAAGTGMSLAFSAPAAPGAYRVIAERDGATVSERALAVRLPESELTGKPPSAAAPAGPAAMATSSREALLRVAQQVAPGRELAGWLAAATLFFFLLEILAARIAAPTPGPASTPDEPVAGSRRGRAGQ